MPSSPPGFDWNRLNSAIAALEASFAHNGCLYSANPAMTRWHVSTLSIMACFTDKFCSLYTWLDSQEAILISDNSLVNDTKDHALSRLFEIVEVRSKPDVRSSSIPRSRGFVTRQTDEELATLSQVAIHSISLWPTKTIINIPLPNLFARHRRLFLTGNVWRSYWTYLPLCPLPRQSRDRR